MNDSEATQEYLVEPGMHVSTACEKAVKMSFAIRENVKFTFNDIVIVASPFDRPEKLNEKYVEECNKRSEAIRKARENQGSSGGFRK